MIRLNQSTELEYEQPENIIKPRFLLKLSKFEYKLEGKFFWNNVPLLFTLCDAIKIYQMDFCNDDTGVTNFEDKTGLSLDEILENFEYKPSPLLNTPNFKEVEYDAYRFLESFIQKYNPECTDLEQRYPVESD